MAKNKKTSLIYITIGAIVALGAVMGASRLFFKDEEDVEHSKLVVNALQEGVNVEGYEIMLAYDDAEKILELCRSAIENSDPAIFEPGYTYVCNIIYAPSVESGGSDVLSIFYDCSENSEEDVLFVLWNMEAIVTVKQSEIFGKATGFNIHCKKASQEDMYFSEWTSTKLAYGVRDLSNEDDMILDSINDGIVCMPEEIIDLVCLVAPVN